MLSVKSGLFELNPSRQSIVIEALRRRRITILFRIVAFVSYYLGAVKVLGWIANRYQPVRAGKSASFVPWVRKRQSRNVQILLYHRINDDGDDFFAATPVKVFAQQMEWLAKNFVVCSLEKAVEGLKCGNLPENAVVVTFDDGYRDNFVNAYPILKRLSIPATIFLATDAIGTGKPLWQDRVFSAFRATRQFYVDGLEEDIRKYPLRTLDERISALLKVLRCLWSMDHAKRLWWIEELLKKLMVRPETLSTPLMLTWDDVRTMHRNGISFGSHTVNHPILAKMCPAEASWEIYVSKQMIEDVLGCTAATFAYPVGRAEDFNHSIKAMVEEAGYVCAVTTVFGSNEVQQDLFELKRGNPWELDIPSFATKLSWYKFTT